MERAEVAAPSGVVRIAVIGGSGLYAMEGLRDATEVDTSTPYGPPSSPVTIGRLQGVPVAFLARHGKTHSLLPAEVPYRANIHALKQLGVQYLISVSAVGSLREEVQPLDLVLPEQFLDMTHLRASTFFGDGAVAHVSMADPTCERVREALARAVARLPDPQVRLHTGGTYVCIDGPSFSTRAESLRYRGLGASVIGMTNMPEAKLAREAEIAYATLALVTDWDCWRADQACVTAEMAIANLRHNAERAKAVLSAAVAELATTWPPSRAHRALDAALVTPASAMPPATRLRLSALLDRFERREALRM